MLFKTFFFILFLFSVISSSKTKQGFGRSFSLANEIEAPQILSDAGPSIPYYADFNAFNVQCDNVPSGVSTVTINGESYIDVNIPLKGGINDGFCAELIPTSAPVKKSSNLSNKAPTPLTNFACKIADMSIVYQVVYGDLCAEFQNFEFIPDSVKKDITNGQSCHCPGLGDARFAECEYKYTAPQWASLSDLIYPNNVTYDPTFKMCHYLTSHGMSKGCFANDLWTEVYLKFYTNYKALPIMKMKPKSIEEIILTCYINDFPPFNVSLTDLGSYTTSVGFVNITFGVGAETFDDHLFRDYTIVSNTTNFNDVSSIFMIDNDRVNDIGMYSKEKACSIRVTKQGLAYDEETIANGFVNSYQSTNCAPAEGIINYPLTTFKNLMGPQSALVNKISPNTLFLDPAAGLLKVKAQGNVMLNMKIKPPSGVTYSYNAQLADTTFSNVHFVCGESINQDGFPCYVTYDYTGSGSFDIISRTATDNIIATEIATPEKKSMFLLPTIYTNKVSVQLCLKPRNIDISNPSCSVVALSIKWDRNNDVSNSTDNGQDNTQGNGGGDGILKGTDGKLRGWAIGVITGISALVFIIILAIFGPYLFMFVKWIMFKLAQAVKYIKPMLEKKKADLERDMSDTSMTPMSTAPNSSDIFQINGVWYDREGQPVRI